MPKVTFKTRVNEQWKHVSSNDLFKGKTVVVFSLPGAYTPSNADDVQKCFDAAKKAA